MIINLVCLAVLKYADRKDHGTKKHSDARLPDGLNLLSFPLEVSAAPNSVAAKISIASKIKTIYIDGVPLHELLGDTGAHLTSCLDNSTQFPTAGAFTKHYGQATAPFAEFGDLTYMGLALAGAVAGPFPLHKIPVLTCCGDPLCGYPACTVTFSKDTITWSDFGTVWPVWPIQEDNFELGERWSFDSFEQNLCFTFGRSAYEEAFAATLVARDQRISRSEAAAVIPSGRYEPVVPLNQAELRATERRRKDLVRKEDHEREVESGPDPLFVRILDRIVGGRSWPTSECTRLSNLLALHDPLHLATHGRLSSRAYDADIIEDSRCSSFVREPQATLNAQLKKAFGVNPDPARVTAIVEAFLTPLRSN